MSDTHRAFIAIPIPAGQSLAIRDCALGIERQAWDFYSWSYSKGLHLTLYFLGEITPETEATIVESLSGITWSAFSLQLADLLLMPEPEVPKIVSAAVAGDLPALLRLQQSIHDRVFGQEVYKETRRYLPHVTFGRIRKDKPTRARVLKQAIATAVLGASGPWDVREFSLYRSSTKAGSQNYENIATFVCR